jgi:hypothetical protein
MISGLAASLPTALGAGLRAHHVPAQVASAAAASPPVSVLFAAFLGYNPVEHLVGAQVLAQVPAPDVAALTSTTFFPALIAGPFADGLHVAFGFAIAACLVAAAASWSRGSRYVDTTGAQALSPPSE